MCECVRESVCMSERERERGGGEREKYVTVHKKYINADMLLKI